jgi:hypothetical protein
MQSGACGAGRRDPLTETVKAGDQGRSLEIACGKCAYCVPGRRELTSVSALRRRSLPLRPARVDGVGEALIHECR